ncbi:Alpha/beta hydrolase fold protein [Kangiella sediminilitoris]|uniref:Alpha/beta hydrolase fold protein n=2 Tax=Kangiella sediminilitoris TaxID=1144748 RepID=A0A1B3BDC8_9GAMM|nr:Alpha/beta hydrolase fold protein [Kangiella sediminilitoris]
MSTNSIQTTQYKAPFGCSNEHFQSLLATFKLRRNNLKKQAHTMLLNSEERIIECEDGIKLQSFYTPAASSEAPLAILIHGWEGSHESLYQLSTANTLYHLGFSIIRLNLRDHGTSHHLNAELFHSNRLDEVVQAVARIEQDFKPSKLLLCGFSLGGNFALRVTNRAKQAGISLTKTIAVCPALDPADILIKLETSFSLYMKYFMHKWKRSIRKKQELFPDLYDLEEDLQTDSMRDLTEKLVQYYGDYQTINDYFDGYNICGDRLAQIDTPTTILMSKDDPIIDYQGIYTLPETPYIKRYLTEHGGHCGYIKNYKLDSWIDDFIKEQSLSLLQD